MSLPWLYCSEVGGWRQVGSNMDRYCDKAVTAVNGIIESKSEGFYPYHRKENLFC